MNLLFSCMGKKKKRRKKEKTIKLSPISCELRTSPVTEEPGLGCWGWHWRWEPNGHAQTLTNTMHTGTGKCQTAGAGRGGGDTAPSAEPCAPSQHRHPAPLLRALPAPSTARPNGLGKSSLQRQPIPPVLPINREKQKPNHQPKN